ncbi:MAG: ABC transporter permease [Acidobacteria bacterium]|nr:ABC transporter permease [Acidobacteriota bacterium]MBU4307467.1 ABC transporter permease [Acidobacteriota bacterium]MBU4404708.1 ABC transporter permease [Acidobacteriota bacterium]MCG2812891.1 ABC transporter permease [Candidatus Aminicenantes bacterium]
MKMKIKAIAVNTFKESARNKMFYLLVFFGILFALSSKLISFLTLGDAIKVLKDTGLAAINFFCVLIAIFTGINLVYKEIEKKTVFNILSKPVSRDQFIIGKFLGLALTMLTALAAMAGIFFLFVALSGGGFDLKIILYFFMLFLELLVIVAISLLFSSFTTPILSFIFTVSLYLIGHIMWTFNEFKLILRVPFWKYFTQALYYLLPNLDKFNIKNEVVMNTALNPWTIFFSVLYALAYILALLAVTILIFRKRDFQ